MKEDRFVLITGLSGSGKTCVSRFLEDIGYYCIDNLPVKLIPILVDFWTRKEVEIEKIALVVDIREKGFTKKFPEVLKAIQKKIDPTLVFLDASDTTLIKRYSESRRPHPLSPKKSIAEVIADERKSLAEIREIADEVIDTSSMGISQLKGFLTRRFSRGKGKVMKVVILSFGYKYGLPLDSDLVFDMRCLPNPFYIDRLREKTGKTKSVIKYIFKFDETRSFLKELFHFLDKMMPRFANEGKGHLTISMGCTGGKHRSVVIADEVSRHLKANGYKTTVYHRDIQK
ncbi:MAG: RNase adapter RapZ [Candidatus Aminicenantes bacterium]|nr:RNase adapter RapZ [Candidatus Aminicenantes bacterium]